MSMVFVEVVENVGRTIEALGVGVTAIAVVASLGRYGISLAARSDPEATYQRARHDVGRGVLLGLEVLVAGDIIRTVGVNPTPTSVAVLAAVVLIRTLLTITIRTEIAREPPARHTPNDALPMPPKPARTYVDDAQSVHVASHPT